jgi:E3 ubiquitin-protein ligase DOA10
MGGLKENMKSVGIDSGKACRICLEDIEEPDNPFITPCKCTGSVKFIHLKCLREWLDSKRVS